MEHALETPFHRLPPLWFTTSSQFILLQHRVEPLVAEDQVIQHPDTEQLARLQQPMRDLDIVVAGDEEAAVMVVCDHDRGSP